MLLRFGETPKILRKLLKLQKNSSQGKYMENIHVVKSFRTYYILPFPAVNTYETLLYVKNHFEYFTLTKIRNKNLHKITVL